MIELAILVSASTLVLGAYGVFTYNRFVSLKEDATAGKKNIDVELDRRAKVLVNLGAAASRHMTHESEVFTKVAELRAGAYAAKQAGDVALQSRLENGITSILPKLTATVEAYPDLQADEVVLQLMESLEHTENRLGFAKSFYNGAAQAFNEARKMFPAVLVASLFSAFKSDLAYWEVSDEIRVSLEAKNIVL